MKVGLRKFYAAKYEESNGSATYSNGKVIAKPTKLDSNPEFYNQEFYAGDALDDVDAGFKKVALTVGINGLDLEDEQLLYGYTYTAAVTTQGSEAPASSVSKGDSEGSEVGIGFISRYRKSGVTKYMAIIYHRVKFSEGSESIETKGESLKMEAETLSGVGMLDCSGKWRTKLLCDTEAIAEDAIKTFLGIED